MLAAQQQAQVTATNQAMFAQQAAQAVEAKATVVRDQLNKLGPYYDPNYESLKPVTR